MELFPLEVESGDDILLLSVGKAYRPISLHLGAEEPAWTGSRLKAAGGTIFSLDKSETFGPISIFVQVCDVHLLQPEMGCISSFDTGQTQGSISDPQEYGMRLNGNHVNFLFQVSVLTLQVACHQFLVPHVENLLVDIPDSVRLLPAAHLLKGEGRRF